MNIQNTLDLIPIDLLHEIFSRLPAKSVGRCRCVSKKSRSILTSEDFKQLFLNRSVTRPRLFSALDPIDKKWIFYSSPQPQNPYEKSSLVVRADFHTKFPFSSRNAISYACGLYGFSYASGLFYFPDVEISSNNTLLAICNPITGQYVILPKLRINIVPKSFLGFDPIDKQFKLLVMNAQANRVNNERINFIITLGTGKMKWRTIKCPLLLDNPLSYSNGISINGVLYYLTRDIGTRSYVLVCFDVRTETFKFKPIVIEVQCIISLRLINHKGKLGITILSGDNTIELDMLVLEDEDVEKQEWSKYTFPSTIKFNYGTYVVGMTSTDEIVLSTTTCKPVYVYYFNPEKNSLKTVEVQGFERNGKVHVFMDHVHVEDLYLNDAMYFK